MVLEDNPVDTGQKLYPTKNRNNNMLALGSWPLALVYANNQQPTINNQWIGLVGNIDSPETIRFDHDFHHGAFSWAISGFNCSVPNPLKHPPPASAPLHCRVGWALGAWTLPCPSHPPDPRWTELDSGRQNSGQFSTLGVLPIHMGTVCMYKYINININIYIYISCLYIYIYISNIYICAQFILLNAVIILWPWPILDTHLTFRKASEIINQQNWRFMEPSKCLN